MHTGYTIYKYRFAVLFALIAFSVSPAFADVTFTSSQAEFLAAHPDAASQDFRSISIPADQFANCDSPVNASSNDDCFTPGFILPALELTVNLQSGTALFALFGPNYRGSSSPPNVLSPSIANTSLDITFPVRGASAVGFVVGCLDSQTGTCNQNLTIEIFGVDGGLLGQTTVQGTSGFNTFLGIDSTTPIERVSIFVPGQTLFVSGVTQIWFRIANIDIPTLGEWGLIAAAAGLMIVGVFFAVRKRRAAPTN